MQQRRRPISSVKNFLTASSVRSSPTHNHTTFQIVDHRQINLPFPPAYFIHADRTADRSLLSARLTRAQGSAQ